ncbi:DUF3857 domain-containing protein [Aequorivita sp. KMM 9714]|uniref:DUF3857 domain-containing protein n=1 Tax=Aequorivita sp. KMM 9714 TaxID=2707173 RepID=UPI0013EC92C8|nr:DUF3857 domain-containing protein [Aequorivita sp. KMM 9714]NGX84597.1 DUF3857 domain-containing protein [Aequorivita sp. KMM 9714]
MKKITCLVLLLCTVITFSQNDFSIASINKELLEYTNSVLIDESVALDVTDFNTVKTSKRRVIAVLNKMGNGDTNLYEYYDDNSKVKNIRVWIYNAFGKEIASFKKKDFNDVSRTGISIYSDDRLLYLNYTPTTYPYIVVYESETESGDSAFIQPWQPLGGYAESTQKSVFKIKYNPLNKPNYSARNIEDFDISISDTDNELTFTALNLKAVRLEEHSPSSRSILPHVMVALENFKLKGTSGTSENWQKFGSWLDNKLLADVSDLPEGTKAKVRSLVANETTNEGKARKIYQFVQDKVRYVSIQIGIGGWKPMPASDVDKLSYGDCKALTMYTKSLLEVVGVPSYYTLVNAGENIMEIEENFATPWFNHAILAIPEDDGYTWLECTSQDTPYGYLGDFTDNRDVLIMTPEGGKVTRTKTYTTQENLQTNFTNLTVDAQGNVTAHFKGVSEGIQYDSKYLLPKQKQEDIDRFYKKRWSYVNGFTVDDIKFINDREEVIFTENIEVSVPNYANPVGEDFLFCPNIFNQNKYIPPRIDDRKQNLFIRHGFVDVDTVEVALPENFGIDGLPEDLVLETKFGKYEVSFNETDENKLIYSRKLRIEEGEYPPNEYEEYRDFLRSIARLDKTKILLKQNVQ